MSDSNTTSPRPVSLVVIVFVLALSAAFLLVIGRFYKPSTVAPQNQTAENFPVEQVDAQTKEKKPSDLAWKATPASRRAALLALQEKQAKQAATYAWVDEKKKDAIQLPIDRAMELVVQQYGPKK